MTSYFYSEAKKNPTNANFLSQLESYAGSKKTLIYVLSRPLTDQKYTYTYSQSLIILAPKHKVAIINYGDSNDEFLDYVEDVFEDIGSISDKYLYKEILGRPRAWRESLTTVREWDSISDGDVESLFASLKLSDAREIKKIDLVISLFIGSINDIDRIKAEIPITILDKVKQKIQLFDGDQTRFVYQSSDKKRIIIQGLSGTGKTELLLHKLKDLYISDSTSLIYFTCHNRILADNLRSRIPSFFNFMKVEQQIEWEKRLWCTNAWGSTEFPNSGAYRYICHYYQVPFFPYSHQMPFSKACKLATDEIKEKYKKDGVPHAFTYMLIDESQDFDEAFFELCELVTEKNIYLAGDIFQNIFDKNTSNLIQPDYLLGKCYRTDPTTLMFAHGLGMGLFEKTKLRWLEEKEWRDCGYEVSVNDNKFYLSREPLRRFEDLDDNFESIKIVEPVNVEDTVIQIIKEIRNENKTVLPDDIGIILLDSNDYIYQLAYELELKIRQQIGWSVNKAYETKEKKSNAIFISNRNNVKGLEFPFIICITQSIKGSLHYRNSLYTMLTRSFIKSFLLVPKTEASGLTDSMKSAWREILTNRQMVIDQPSKKEQENIRTRFETASKQESHYDVMMKIFKKENIDKKYHNKFFNVIRQMELIDNDEETLTNCVRSNRQYLEK
jgi:superfamily I DNA and RNA helicase